MTFSLFIISLVWPGAYCDPGVQLTFAALLGLLCGASLTQENRWLSLLSASVMATFFTSIVSLLWFDVFSPIGFLLNPVLAPLFSLISCHAGFIALALFYSGLDRDGWTLQCIMSSLRALADRVVVLSELPWSAIMLSEEPKYALVMIGSALAAYVVYRSMRCRAYASL